MDQADLLKLSSLLNKFQKECVAERKEIIPGLFGEVYNAENVQREKDINNIIMIRYLVSEKINEGIAPIPSEDFNFDEWMKGLDALGGFQLRDDALENFGRDDEDDDDENVECTMCGNPKHSCVCEDALGCREVTDDELNDALLCAITGNPLGGYWYIDRKIFDVKPISYWSS